jgi:hypothetical protein
VGAPTTRLEVARRAARILGKEQYSGQETYRELANVILGNLLRCKESRGVRMESWRMGELICRWFVILCGWLLGSPY